MPGTKRLVVLLLLLAMAGCGGKGRGPRALSPQDALKSFHLSEDFRVELYASEPEVEDPVEMAFDEDGRVYVAEMRDYPDDPPPGKPARSRIRMLEDRDGDGRIDRSWIFADEVLQVSGLMPWKGGLLVTSAPDILFMKDTDGDGKADIRKVLYTGFPKVNSEARITNLRLGIDNWIYAANNGSDGKVTSPDHPERPPIVVRGTDFRFRPDRDLAEPASGPTQFGMTFDDWGNRFLTQNTIHIRHSVVPMQYLARAPSLGVPAVSQDISDHGRPSVRMFQLTKPQAWREQRTTIRQHRHHENQNNVTELLSGYFTAASGGTVYTGDAFPEEYRGNVFTGDVAGNLVHRDILTPDGATFSARRSKDGVEFLASTDVWSRICNFANAPDGNLYMTDIYREFIETPESIPESIKKGMDFWSGDTLGRIYRMVPNKPRVRRDLKPRLGAATTAELVAALTHANGWHRQTAQRLLLDRQDPEAVPLLEALTESDDFPQGRLHALWTLEGYSALSEEMLLRALKDPHAAIREHALRLSEPFLGKSRALAAEVLALTGDPEPRVRFQLALTLGELKQSQKQALDALARIASTHAGDRWFRVAILSSVSDAALQLFEALQARRFAWEKAGENSEFLFQIASLIGAKQDGAEVTRFLNLLTRVAQPEAALRGLANGFRLAGVSGLRAPGADAALLRYLNNASEPVQKAAWEAARYLELRAIMEKAKREAVSASLSVEKRAVAIRALRGGTFAAAGKVLEQVLESAPPPELQAAAIEALAALEGPAVAPVLVANWRHYSPDARGKALDALLNHRDRTPVLLKAVADGQIEPGEVNVAARARLIESSDPETAQTARRLFQDQATDRARLVERYQDVLRLKGEPGRGKSVFETNCAKCHLQRRQGARVGPDLSGVNNKTREELLASILNPSTAIEPRYINYLVTTKGGRMYDGVIANETPGSITLRDGSDEGDELILRKSIAEIRASRISLMPEDLEKNMSRQDLADLIAYLRAGL